MKEHDDFDSYSERWGLIPDGDLIMTRSSRLFPVRCKGEPAMLKIAVEAEEKWGAGLMVWWNGIGAARVLAHEDNAMLLERATGSRSLVAMVAQGQDDEASHIMCSTIAELHAWRGVAPPELSPLAYWFRALGPMASREGGILVRCASIAQKLLAEPREIVPLHGDIHHGNVLDFGERGWLAIDPKRLEGERGFDYANLFCNPNHAVVLAPGRLVRQVEVVSKAAGLERKRLLQWILAWAGLSAAWFIEAGERERVELTQQVAEMAAAELDRSCAT